jgi:hypothetical protein
MMILSDPSMYRQLVGNLNYLTIIRPDISFVVHQVNRYMQALSQTYLLIVFFDISKEHPVTAYSSFQEILYRYGL